MLADFLEQPPVPSIDAQWHLQGDVLDGCGVGQARFGVMVSGEDSTGGCYRSRDAQSPTDQSYAQQRFSIQGAVLFLVRSRRIMHIDNRLRQWGADISFF